MSAGKKYEDLMEVLGCLANSDGNVKALETATNDFEAYKKKIKESGNPEFYTYEEYLAYCNRKSEEDKIKRAEMASIQRKIMEQDKRERAEWVKREYETIYGKTPEPVQEVKKKVELEVIQPVGKRLIKLD